MDILNEESSWSLILEKVFGKEASCPNELEENGKSIARRCGGLPLALVVIGGLLAKSEKTKEFWKYVEENITSVANYDNDENWMKILTSVGQRWHTGKVKNCRIHDLVTDMCMREAEKTLQNENKRRLSIHKGTSKEEAADRLSLLKVLDVDDHYSINEIERLFNSRYIACSVRRNQRLVLSFISLHWNLQTLVFPAPISLPSEFWQMSQLRHLKAPSITLSDPQQANVESESVTVLEHLQTLSTVKNFIFRENITLRNVRKLGIDCDATNEVESFCLYNLVLLHKLESLALAFRGTWLQMNFPVSLKKLTLSHCEGPWEDMYVVGSLPKLEVLKLQACAAKGLMWNPNEGEFRRLKMLLINQCELEVWGADDTHFPCLEHLQIIRLRMEEIPMEFAKVSTLQTIYLSYCRRSLSASAQRMSKARDYYGNEDVHV